VFDFTKRSLASIVSNLDQSALVPAGCLSSIESDPVSVVVLELEIQAVSPRAVSSPAKTLYSQSWNDKTRKVIALSFHSYEAETSEQEA
jgi:hypothetical protein